MIPHVLADGFLLHPLGYCAGTARQVMECRGYNSWSGIISDLPEIAVFATVATMLAGLYHHFKCQHCKRPGRHTVHVNRPDGHVETHRTCKSHLDEDHYAKARA